jgi:glycosyltransferase involved in cell wall biosynthesis
MARFVEEVLLSANSGPLVSVIVPSYNHEAFVREAIESVLNSSVQDLEVIVVDDGSTDGSVERIQSVRDDRVRLLVQANAGAHNAINRGVELAEGEFIAILNSDDRLHREKLARHLEIHRVNPDLEASASRVRYILQNGDPVGESSYFSKRYEKVKAVYFRHGSLFSSLLAVNHLITTSSLFMRRDVFREIGGLVPLRYVHDWFMFLSLAARGRFSIIEEALVDYRRHPGNTVVQDDDMGRVEDNFVLEWHLFNQFSSGSPLIPLPEATRLLENNKRVNFTLLYIFQLWREMNQNDLTNTLALFEDRGNPLLEYARKIIEQERRPWDLRPALRRLFLRSRLYAAADFMMKIGTVLRRSLYSSPT